MNKLYKIGTLIGIVGLLLFLIIILSGAAYPDIIFRILTPLALLLVFVSIIVVAIGWFKDIRDGIKLKNYGAVAVLLIAGLIVIIQMVN